MSNTLVRVSFAMNRHHDYGNSYKGNNLIGARLQIRGLVDYHHIRKHGGVQTNMELEKELRVLHLNKIASGRESHAGSGLRV